MLLYAYPKYSSSVNADLGHSSSWLKLSVMLITKGPRNKHAVKAVDTSFRPISFDGTMFAGRLKARPSSLSKHSICCNSQFGTWLSEYVSRMFISTALASHVSVSYQNWVRQIGRHCLPMS